MQRIGINGILLARLQQNLMKHRISAFGRRTIHVFRFLTGYIKVDPAPPAAESFLLAVFAADRRMTVLRVGLMRKQYHFFGAAPFCIHISKKLKSGMFQIV